MNKRDGEFRAILGIRLALPGSRPHELAPLALRHLTCAQPESFGQRDFGLFFIGAAVFLGMRAPHRELTGRTPCEFELEAIVVTFFARSVPLEAWRCRRLRGRG